MNALFRNSTIRHATVDDLPFMLEIAKERYGARVQDREGLAYVRWCITQPSHMVLVGLNSFGIAQISVRYGYERKARLAMLAARRQNKAWIEVLQMVRVMVNWAALNKAEGAFRIDADTGVDFGPLAKRLGGEPVNEPAYDIPLDGGLL